MKKQEAIKNEFDTGFQIDKYKIGSIKELVNIDASGDALAAFKSKDLPSIESAIEGLAKHARSAILLIGIGCVIIDRESLYEAAGYRSYLEYASHLFEKMGLPPQTLSDAKIIAETYIDRFSELKKAGFKIEGNAHKLRYVKIAIENHPKKQDEVFERVTTNTLREFIVWAKSRGRKVPEYNPTVKVTATRISIDGKNILNFDEDLSAKEKENIAGYLSAVYKIRESGNEPFILDTYDAGEQRAILNFQKKYRATK